MRYPPEHKAQTRERILRAAADVFRQHGYHAAGLDKVMEAAGLTAGAFYSHFPSKEALLAEVLPYTLRHRPQALWEAPPSGDDEAWLVEFIERYLSTVHRDHPERGCLLPPVISELSRTGEPSREAFEAFLRAFQQRVAGHLGSAEDDATANERALALVALCVGGLTLARALPEGELGEQVLAACRKQALDILATNRS